MSFGKKKWWKRCTETDPISLEPLAELDYPPFELTNTESGVSHLFDGEVLAYYMISQGIFLNPITREPIDRTDCMRLDQYLRQNNLREANVEDAHALSKLVKGKKGIDEAPSHVQQRSTMQRREATAVLSSFFQFKKYDKQRPPGHSGAPRSVFNDGNLTVIDDDDLTAEAAGVTDANCSREYDLEADFPSLPQQPRSAPVESSSQLQEPVGSSGEREEESEPEASDKESADGRDEGEPVEEGFSADNIANVSPIDEYAEYLKRQEAEQQVRKRQAKRAAQAAKDAAKQEAAAAAEAALAEQKARDRERKKLRREQAKQREVEQVASDAKRKVVEDAAAAEAAAKAAEVAKRKADARERKHKRRMGIVDDNGQEEDEGRLLSRRSLVSLLIVLVSICFFYLWHRAQQKQHHRS